MSLSLTASDLSRQKLVRIDGVRPDTLVGEVVSRLVTRMRLPRNDSSGRPVSYHALLERQGTHLESGRRIGEVARTDDALVIQPRIDAG
ncbi:MAG: hypothetical protein KDC38_05400 [Planctomycetes bacterium]|nr:hypothetical protein [Planctomycetota bacterium]